ncbi:MAG: hypothetical protein M1832_001109 [Thelocarpon impressellum]|nr:MAG: hypothetical protein M1832_001109 [Thelocarpon impressellum]
MLTTPPHLRIRRPSSTTVEFIVSTRPPRSALSGPLLALASLLLRLVVGAAVLAVNYAKWATQFPHAPAALRQPTLQLWLGRTALRLSERVDWWLLLPFSLAVAYAVVRRVYIEESLLVLQGLGIQTSTTSPTYLSTSTTRFIPTNQVQDVFIHEAFRGFEVRFYLAVVVEGEEDVVVVFPVSLHLVL